MGVAALAAAGLLALGHPLVALAAFLAAAAALVVALVQRYGGADRRSEIEHRRFGRGPYVTCPCAPNADLLARLTDILQQLRDAVAKEGWTVDWAPVDGFLAQAASATQAGNLPDAAREYLHAITHLMAQLRQIRSASSDSGGGIAN